jgi:ADP-heptose:LPS heptosyltransferase
MIRRLLRLDYSLKNGLLRCLTRGLFRRAGQVPVRRILVLRVGTLGDGVCALPALATLRANFPAATIHLLTRTGGDAGRVSLAQLVAPDVVDEVIPFESANLWVLSRFLRRRQYDWFVELSQSHARFRNQLGHLLWAWWMGFPTGFGWEITATRWFRRFQAAHGSFPDERTRLLQLLARNGLRVSPRLRFPLAIRPADAIFVEDLLATRGLGDASRNVALVVGAARPQNRWPVASFAAVSRWLLDRGFRVLLVGGADDAPLAAQLPNKPGLHDFTGKLTPVQSAVLLRHCRVCVANDTGTMHLSYAVGTPVLALFSARDYPGLWFPPAALGRVFRNTDLACAGCLSARCADNQCLKRVAPDAVVRALEPLLGLPARSSFAQPDHDFRD